MNITWGNAAFTFERPVFQAGFQSGRACYFYEEDGERSLTDTELLTVIATASKEGHYRIDFSLLDHPLDGTEELLGVLIGYLSAPIIPESDEERTERLSGIVEMTAV